MVPLVHTLFAPGTPTDQVVWIVAYHSVGAAGFCFACNIVVRIVAIFAATCSHIDISPPFYVCSPVVVWRHLGDHEREDLGGVHPDEVLLGDVGLAMCVREDR